MVGPTGTYVERGCSESLTWDKVCYSSINTSYNAVTMSFETCTKEKCNGSDRMSFGILIIPFITFITFFSIYNVMTIYR